MTNDTAQSGWDRLMWGAQFSDNSNHEFLIGETWDRERSRGILHSEPIRALLFITRREASEWCKSMNAEWRSRADCMNKWRVRPVRVRETVAIETP